jgi:hypothetical protein
MEAGETDNLDKRHQNFRSLVVEINSEQDQRNHPNKLPRRRSDFNERSHARLIASCLTESFKSTAV